MITPPTIFTPRCTCISRATDATVVYIPLTIECEARIYSNNNIY